MSPIAHSGIGLLGWQLAASRKNAKTLLLFLFAANLADVDYVLYLFVRPHRYYIHQYYTHNFFFVIIVAGFLALLLPRGIDRLGLVLVGVLHLVQDILVIDRGWPKGIRLFYPLSSKFFNIGIFPSPRGGFRHAVTTRNILIAALEILIFVAPVLIIFWKDLGREFSRRDFWKIMPSRPADPD